MESVSCIFIYYAIDKSFVERGLIAISRMNQGTYSIINRYSQNPYAMDEGQQQDQYNKMGYK